MHFDSQVSASRWNCLIQCILLINPVTTTIVMQAGGLALLVARQAVAAPATPSLAALVNAVRPAPNASQADVMAPALARALDAVHRGIA